jgi:hypothetical protein
VRRGSVMAAVFSQTEAGVCPAICLFLLPRAPLFLLLHDAINRPYYFLTFFLSLLLLITFASHCPYEVSIPQAKKKPDASFALCPPSAPHRRDITAEMYR